MINFKTYSKSYKNKKRYENDKENWAIFKDIHEPIIDRTVWEKIQERRSRRTRKKPVTGEDKEYVFGIAGMRGLRKANSVIISIRLITI